MRSFGTHTALTSPGRSSPTVPGMLPLDHLPALTARHEHILIVKTSDGGTTWTDFTSPANSSLQRVSFAGAAR